MEENLPKIFGLKYIKAFLAEKLEGIGPAFFFENLINDRFKNEDPNNPKQNIKEKFDAIRLKRNWNVISSALMGDDSKIDNTRKASLYNAFICHLILTYCKDGFESILSKINEKTKIITHKQINELLQKDVIRNRLEQISFKINDCSSDSRDDVIKIVWVLILLSFIKEELIINEDKEFSQTYDDFIKKTQEKKYNIHYFPIPDKENWNTRSIIRLLAMRVFSGEKSWTPREVDLEFAEAYFTAMRQDKIRIYTEETDSLIRPPIIQYDYEKIYVDFPISRFEIVKNKEGKEVLEKTGILTSDQFIDNLQDGGIHLLEADAGKGKSTLLHHFFNMLTGKIIQAHWQIAYPFPIWIDCSQLAEAKFPHLLRVNNLGITFDSILKSVLLESFNDLALYGSDKKEWESFTNYLLQHKENLVVFIDGLDEIDSRNIVQAIAKIAKPDNLPTIIIASRPNVLNETNKNLWLKVHHYSIDGLEDDSFLTYIDNLFSIGICKEGTERNKGTFLTAVREKENLDIEYKKITRTPLTLASIIQVYLRSGKLPHNKIEALNDLVQSVFKRDANDKNLANGEFEIDGNESLLMDVFCIILANREYNEGSDEEDLLDRYLGRKKSDFRHFIINHHLLHTHANVKDILIAYGVFLLAHNAFKQRQHNNLYLDILSWLFPKSISHDIGPDWDDEEYFEWKLEHKERLKRKKFIIQCFLFYCDNKDSSFLFYIFDQLFKKQLITDSGFLSFLEEDLDCFLFKSVGLLIDNRVAVYEILCTGLCERDVQSFLDEIPNPDDYLRKIQEHYSDYFGNKGIPAFSQPHIEPLTKGIYSNPYEDLFYYSITVNNESRAEILTACQNILSRLKLSTKSENLTKRLLLELINILNGIYVPSYPGYNDFDDVLNILRGKRKRVNHAGLLVLDSPVDQLTFTPCFFFKCVILTKNFTNNADYLLSFDASRGIQSPQFIIVEQGNPVYFVDGAFLIKRINNHYILYTCFPLLCSASSDSIMRRGPLFSIKIPNYITDLSSTFLSEIPYAKSITVDIDNRYYKAIGDHFLIDKEEKSLIALASEYSNSRCYIPFDEDLSSIAPYAVECEDWPIEMHLSESIKNVKDYAFYLSDISTLYIPNSILRIGFHAFPNEISTIYYNGTTKEWNIININKEPIDIMCREMIQCQKSLSIHCSDKTITLDNCEHIGNYFNNRHN